MMSNNAKRFGILATSFNFEHPNYFDGPIKLFSDVNLIFKEFQ